MHLMKEKCGLPCLRDYYYTAQFRTLICSCSPIYSAGWKDVLERRVYYERYTHYGPFK